MKIHENAALIVIDVQKGFGYERIWARGNHPEAVSNIGALCARWQSAGRPVVCVRHVSRKPVSVFAPWSPGVCLQKELEEVVFDLEIEKSVNSAFLGSPDLHAWLTEHRIRQIVLAGIQTNMCVETTARVGGNLGYDVVVPLDATRTFELRSGGRTFSADELSAVTAANLSEGGFARVTDTESVLKA